MKSFSINSVSNLLNDKIKKKIDGKTKRDVWIDMERQRDKNVKLKRAKV